MRNQSCPPACAIPTRWMPWSSPLVWLSNRSSHGLVDVGRRDVEVGDDGGVLEAVDAGLETPLPSATVYPCCTA